MTATAQAPRARRREDAAVELRAIAARMRLRLYTYIGWTDHVSNTDAWRDRWEDADSRARWRVENERGRELAESLRVVEESLRASPATTRITQIFGLRPIDVDILHGCLAMALDPDLAGSVAAISGRAVPSEAILRAIFDLGAERVLTPESPLVRWDLVRSIELAPGEPDGLVADPAIVDWFTNVFAVEAELVALGRVVRPVEALESWRVDDVLLQLSRRTHEDAPTRVVVVAPPGSGRRSFAACLAARLGLRLFAIDGDRVDDATWAVAVRRAHRQAYLTSSAFAILGEAQHRRAMPTVARSFPLTFAIVEQRELPPAPDAIDIVVELPPATISERAALWSAAFPSWTRGEIDTLAHAYRASPGDVAHVAARNTASVEVAAKHMRDRSRSLLGELAHRIECPFRWNDLVVPPHVDELLREFAFEASERPRVWELPEVRRLFPQGRGLIALWTGTPGTGKTMAAQTIAAELGVDLFRISLSEVVSKYVGETARNMQRVLTRAERMDAILFFDEADALFGRRVEIKDAHDRYANTDTDHLLQAIESYSGISILASNKKANVDPAFTRRLRYVIEFPRPDAVLRRTLWRRLVTALCGEETERAHTSLFDVAATILELSGAQIKVSILGAIFAARRDRQPVTVRHFVRGIERELLKDGRALSEREKERLGG